MRESQEQFESIKSEQDFQNILSEAVELENKVAQGVLESEFLEIFNEDNSVDDRIGSILGVCDQIQFLSGGEYKGVLFDEVEKLGNKWAEMDSVSTREKLITQDNQKGVTEETSDKQKEEILKKLTSLLRKMITDFMPVHKTSLHIQDSFVNKQGGMRQSAEFLSKNSFSYNPEEGVITVYEHGQAVLTMDEKKIPFTELASQMNNGIAKIPRFMQERLEEITKKPTQEQTQEVLDFEKKRLLTIVRNHILENDYSDDQLLGTKDNLNTAFLLTQDNSAKEFIYLSNLITSMESQGLVSQKVFGGLYNAEYTKIKESLGDEAFKSYFRKEEAEFTAEDEKVETQMKELHAGMLIHLKRVIEGLTVDKMGRDNIFEESLWSDNHVLYDYDIDNGTSYNENNGELELYSDVNDDGEVNTKHGLLASISQEEVLDDVEFKKQLQVIQTQWIGALQDELTRLEKVLTVNEADAVLMEK